MFRETQQQAGAADIEHHKMIMLWATKPRSIIATNVQADLQQCGGALPFLCRGACLGLVKGLDVDCEKSTFRAVLSVQVDFPVIAVYKGGC